MWMTLSGRMGMVPINFVNPLDLQSYYTMKNKKYKGFYEQFLSIFLVL